MPKGPPPLWRRVGKRDARVWGLTGVLFACAAAVWLLLVPRVGVLPAAQVHIPWWGLAVLFFAAERWPVAVLLRSSAFNVGLTEVPLVMGLFFATPADVGAGYAAGMALAAVTGLGSRPLRTVFNIGQCVLFIGLATIAFRALGPASPTEWSGWIAAYIATGVLNASCLTTLVALRLLEGRVSRDTAVQTVGLSVLGALVNGGFGLVGAVMLWVDPKALLLTVMPLAALISLYRSYLAERRRREAVEFLRGAGDAFSTSPELEAAILSMLHSARTAFRARIAQLTIFPSAAGEFAYRTTVVAGAADEVMAALPLNELDDLLEAETDGIIVERHKAVRPTQEMLVRRGVDDAMVALLRGRDRILGALFVGGHSTAYVDTYDDRDLRLFRTLAVQTAAVLEKGQIETAVASLTDLQDRLTHQAFHDALTGLPNRSLFGERVAAAIAGLGEGTSRTLGTLLVNLDDFAGINETLGHAAGDDLLVETARRIAGCLRQPDLAARWGGDEFAVLLGDLKDVDEAEIVAKRVLAALRDPVTIGAETVRLRASIGIAIAEGAATAAEDLLRRVDIAMTAAKEAGKSCTVAYVEGMERATVTRHQVRADLEKAIERDQLTIHYQPLVDLADGRVTGTEALLRWWHPERGLIGPADFIPVAEDSGLIVAIGTFVLREACRQTLRWQRRYPAAADWYVSVNVSTRQLQQSLFVEEVMNCLADVEFDPAHLVLELTETMLLDHESPLLGKLESLRRHGIRIAIDDFGTGYSSLSYLRNLPIDILKIAKPFVDDLAAAAEHGEFARAIVGLGNSLKLTLVAEGIEETIQVERLRAMGCTYGQGYLLCHPVGQGEIDKLLSRGGVVSALGGEPVDDEEGGTQVIHLRRSPT